jgi:hypothetical protein
MEAVSVNGTSLGCFDDRETAVNACWSEYQAQRKDAPS